ncbi:DUF6703 family protein [Dermacoccaceae bacterium W4C1]
MPTSPEQQPASEPASSAARPSVRTSALRSRIEHASHPLLERLQALPPAAPLLIAFAVAVLGLIFRGIVGAICFGLLSLVLIWFLYLSWPRLKPLDRMMRGTVLLLTLALTVVLAASH